MLSPLAPCPQRPAIQMIFPFPSIISALAAVKGPNPLITGMLGGTPGVLLQVLPGHPLTKGLLEAGNGFSFTVVKERLSLS